MTKITIMKHFFLFILINIVFFPTVLFAQTPQQINYQAVARDLAGNPMINAPLNLVFEIHQGTATGTVVYSETQTDTTNQFGLFTAAIGAGTVTFGNFSTINWGFSSFYLQVTVNGNIMQATQLLSVPYALYANSSANGPQGLPGNNGLNCWDTNGNGVQDPAEDINGDGFFNTLDCKGDSGVAGVNGTNGVGITWLGSFITPPAAGTMNDAYYNSTDGISYIFNGTTLAWDTLVASGGFIPDGDWIIAGNNMSSGLAGNVGIGTLTPNKKLSVRSAAATGDGISINNIGTGDPGLQFETQGTPRFVLGIDQSDNNKFKIGTTAVNTTPRLTIDNVGNIGIGTIAPTSKLDVVGKIQTDSIRIIGGAAPGNVLTSDALGNATWQPLASSSSPWTKTFNNIYPTTLTDNIGIGLNNPTQKLTVFSPDSVIASFTSSSTNFSAIALTNTNNADLGILMLSGTDTAIFGYVPSQKMLVVDNSTLGGDISLNADNSVGSYAQVIGNIAQNQIFNQTPAIYNQTDTIFNFSTTGKITSVNQGDFLTDSLYVLGNNSFMPNWVLANDGTGQAKWTNPSTLGLGSLWQQNSPNIYFNTGNVGIGTANPNALLNIVSPVSVPLISLEGTGMPNQTLEFVYGGITKGYEIISSAPGGIDIEATGADAIRFETSALERMRITSGGNVGIGNMNPLFPLHVRNTSGVQIAADVTSVANGSGLGLLGAGTEYWRMWRNGTTNRLDFIYKPNNTNLTALVIDTLGDVGIGTTTPTAPLEVAYSNSSVLNPALIINNTMVGGTSSINFNFNGARQARISKIDNNGFFIGTTNTNNFNLGTNNINRIYINGTTGRVGIGAPGPSSEFQVIGTTTTDGLRVTTSPITGYVLTSDAVGNATWQAPVAPPSLWARTGVSNMIHPANLIDSVGIGTSTPLAKLHVAVGGILADWSNTAGADPNLTVVNVNGGSPGYSGGTLGQVTIVASPSAENKYAIQGIAGGTNGNKYGVYGGASGPGLTNYGLYGSASGSTTNWAGYFAAGNVFIQDTLVLPTGAGTGLVLTSDLNGKATWLPPADDGDWIKTGATLIASNTTPNAGIGVFGGSVQPNILGIANNTFTISSANIQSANKIASLELVGTSNISGSLMGQIDFIALGTGAVVNNIARIAAFSPTSQNTGALAFSTSDGTNFTEHMRITETGNVGIGTFAPTTKLDVIGTFKLTDGTQGLGKILTSDATGNATWKPNQIGFEAYLISNSYVLPSGINTPQAILFDAFSFNDGNGFNTATGEFTAPVAGVYSFQVTLNCSLSGISTPEDMMALIFLNGSPAKGVRQSLGSSSYNVVTLAITLALNANDTVAIYSSDQNGSATIGGQSTWFSGHLVYAY